MHDSLCRSPLHSDQDGLSPDKQLALVALITRQEPCKMTGADTSDAGGVILSVVNTYMFGVASMWHTAHAAAEYIIIH